MARSSAATWVVALVQLIFDVATFLALHRIMPRTPTAKNWCFTWNNYPEDWKDQIKDKIRDYGLAKATSCTYIVVGKEVGESGTPHLQGFVTFDKAVSKPAQNLFQAHWEVAKNVVAASEYCKKGSQSKQEWETSGSSGPNFGKDADVWECGDPPRKRGRQGERSELEEFRESVKEHFDRGEPYTAAMARAFFPSVAAQFPKFVKETIADFKPRRQPEPHPLREWQQELNGQLNREADRRTIQFIVDETGNTGKTWFSMYYRHLHDDVQIISPGKFHDMAYIVEENTRVFFIDLPRESLEYFPYKFLEALKNGFVSSHKYVPETKEWSHNCHVVVMMNQMPDETKLSRDRIKITRI